MTSSGLWLVPLSISATRSSVGTITGRPSVYLANLGVYRTGNQLLSGEKKASASSIVPFEDYPPPRRLPPAGLSFLFGQGAGQGVDDGVDHPVDVFRARQRT